MKYGPARSRRIRRGSWPASSRAKPSSTRSWVAPGGRAAAGAGARAARGRGVIGGRRGVSEPVVKRARLEHAQPARPAVREAQPGRGLARAGRAAPRDPIRVRGRVRAHGQAQDRRPDLGQPVQRGPLRRPAEHLVDQRGLVGVALVAQQRRVGRGERRGGGAVEPAREVRDRADPEPPPQRVRRRRAADHQGPHVVADLAPGGRHRDRPRRIEVAQHRARVVLRARSSRAPAAIASATPSPRAPRPRSPRRRRRGPPRARRGGTARPRGARRARRGRRRARAESAATPSARRPRSSPAGRRARGSRARSRATRAPRARAAAPTPRARRR